MKKLLSIILLSALLFSCKKEQPKPQDLDCSCVKEVSAEFLMEELSGNQIYGILATNTDSIFGTKNVRFSALEENAEYTWYLGSEIINDKSFERFFSNSMVGQTLPVTLVTRKNPNSICFPNDDGYDSIVKYLTIAKPYLYDYYDTILIEGTYRLKPSFQNDSIELTIDYNFPNTNQRYFNIYNYDGMGSDCISYPNGSSLPGIVYSELIGVNYRQIKFMHITNCGHLTGDIHVKMSGEVIMCFSQAKYVNGVWTLDAIKYELKGRRL